MKTDQLTLKRKIAFAALYQVQRLVVHSTSVLLTAFAVLYQALLLVHRAPRRVLQRRIHGMLVVEYADRYHYWAHEVSDETSG